jgi:hypothetical protein
VRTMTAAQVRAHTDRMTKPPDPEVPEVPERTRAPGIAPIGTPTTVSRPIMAA